MSSEDTTNTIKRRLRSAGEDLAQHTLETAKHAAKGLENTHAAYIYPIQVFPAFVLLTYLQGIYYFLAHPRLLRPFFASAVTSVALATGIVVATCFFGYLPQVHVK
jgi:hypothetical protein